MAQVTAAFVDISTQAVLDVQSHDDRRIPADPDGFRYLAAGRDYNPASTEPRLGMLWEGNIPATFIAAPVAEPDPEGPSTQTEALDAAQALFNQGLAMIEQARALG